MDGPSVLKYGLQQREIKAGSYVLPLENPYGTLNSMTKTPIFTAGGHQWEVIFFVKDDFIEFEIVLSSNSRKVYALVDITLVNQYWEPIRVEVRNDCDCNGKMFFFLCRGMSECFKKFIRKNKFDFFLKMESLFAVVNFTVLFSDDECSSCEAPVPPSDLHKDLAILLDDKERSDVTFEAEGELIYAHRLVLAARSSVFKASLYGLLQEDCSKPIKIQDMKAVVFKAMLHFIYTDLAPGEMEDHGDNPEDKIGSVLFTQHLLVAADRYELERLKLICEDKLCRHISTDTVATSLTLAEQHNCRRLKRDCFEFAAKPENYVQMTFSEGYMHMVQSCPSLIQEFQKALIKPPP